MPNNKVVSSQADHKETVFRLTRHSVSSHADSRNVRNASRDSGQASGSARQANTAPSTPRTTSSSSRRHTFSGFCRAWTRENEVQNTPSTPHERCLKREHTFSLFEKVHKRICERQSYGNGEITKKTTVKEVSVRRQSERVYACRR